MTTPPLRIAILGLGSFAARRHVPALLKDPRCRVVAACRRDAVALNTLCDQFGIAERFTEWERLLADTPLDGVVIATPHDQHYRQARAALERGLHVLLEKPMALDTAEAEELTALAQQRGLCLLVAFNPPYWAHTGFLRDTIAGGGIGDLEAADVRWLGSTQAVFGRAPVAASAPGPVAPTLFRADPAANGGGNFADVGGHLVSELLWVTGREPLSVTAQLDDPAQDFRGVVTVLLSGGVPATITLVADSAHARRRVGSLYDGAAGSLLMAGMPFRVTHIRAEGEETRAEADLPPVPEPADDWLTCIRTGDTPRGSAAHGLLVTRTIQAIYRAARENREVRAS